MERIERVKLMEDKFDRLSRAADQLLKAMEAYNAALPLLEELGEYYSGGLWLADYEADEAGLLPHDLKRGVLSQDGLYDLLGKLNALQIILDQSAETTE